MRPSPSPGDRCGPSSLDSVLSQELRRHCDVSGCTSVTSVCPCLPSAPAIMNKAAAAPSHRCLCGHPLSAPLGEHLGAQLGDHMVKPMTGFVRKLPTCLSKWLHVLIPTSNEWEVLELSLFSEPLIPVDSVR